MSTLVTRAGKGSPLTHNEVDANFTNLNTDKAELNSPTFTGTVALPSGTSIGNVSSTEIGYLDGVTSAIQTQINAKGAGTVTSVAATVPSILSISGSPITSSGTLAITYSGTALPIANGGTNATATPTAGTVAYGTGTAYAFTAAGTTGQVLQSNGSSAPSWGAAPAGGSNTQVQYNSSGVLAGSANMTFSGTALTLANDASISGLKVGRGGGADSSNTAVGLNALLNISGAINTVAVGANACAAALGAGGYGVAVGTGALQYWTSNYYNTAVGYLALNSNTSGSSNTALGSETLRSNTTGGSNIAVGRNMLKPNTTGNGNIAIGGLISNTTGDNNTAVGSGTLNSNTTGSSNIGIGDSPLFTNQTANGNIAIGQYALYSFNTTGTTNNIAIGNSAGYNPTPVTTGTNLIYIGTSSRGSTGTNTNEIVIGNSVSGLGSNTTIIGNSSTTGNYVYGQKYQPQPAITALTATATLTIAQMLTNIITVTSATAVTLTLPTGTATDAGIIGGTLPVRGSFDWSIINLGSALGAVTIANGTDHTFVGGTVPIGESNMFRTVKTATNTYITYLIS